MSGLGWCKLEPYVASGRRAHFYLIMGESGLLFLGGVFLGAIDLEKLHRFILRRVFNPGHRQ